MYKADYTPGKYERHAADIGALVDRKNAAYGDSFRKSGDIVRTLYPQGIKPEQCDDALVMARIIDKLFRIATQKTAFGEDPWQDIAGYALLMSQPVTEQQGGGNYNVYK
jgi:hypothetical protein